VNILEREKEKEVMLSKQYRGQIIRILVMFYPTPITMRQIRISLQEYGVGNGANILKYLAYLAGRKYIECDGKDILKCEDDDLILLTPDGVDLADGTKSDEGLYL
jgi:hypothetical protein